VYAHGERGAANEVKGGAAMRLDQGDPAAVHQARRQAIESLIDEIGAQSFPASDPPAWGVAAAQLERAETNAGVERVD